MSTFTSLLMPVLLASQCQIQRFRSYHVSAKIEAIIPSFELQYCPFKAYRKFFKNTTIQSIALTQLWSPVAQYHSSILASSASVYLRFQNVSPYITITSLINVRKQCRIVSLANLAPSQRLLYKHPFRNNRKNSKSFILESIQRWDRPTMLVSQNHLLGSRKAWCSLRNKTYGIPTRLLKYDSSYVQSLSRQSWIHVDLPRRFFRASSFPPPRLLRNYSPTSETTAHIIAIAAVLCCKTQCMVTLETSPWSRCARVTRLRFLIFIPTSRSLGLPVHYGTVNGCEDSDYYCICKHISDNISPRNCQKFAVLYFTWQYCYTQLYGETYFYPQL